VTTIVPVQTCRECGAQHANLTPECPLCGHDPRFTVVEAALTEAGKRWADVEQTTAMILNALDQLTREAHETEDDDA
jgi:ABC-type ATPase with predicted acetyltransferase domain